MAALATQGLLWLWLIIFGVLMTRRLLRTDDPWLTFGSAIPITMLCILGLFFPLARLFGHPQGWILGSLFLFVSTVVLYVKREGAKAPELRDFGFSTFQWASFMTLLTAANVVMHTEEATGPADDLWIHFPLISLLNRGEFPPPNPFFNDVVLHGHFGRDYLVAIIGWFSGGGEALLSSMWSLNHLLSVSAFLLAFGLGRRQGGTAGGFLMSCFLFFGISVGSRVGLVDTFDNNNLLVYSLLLLFVAFETTKSDSKWSDVFLAFGLGVYGIVYETHLLMFCLVLCLGPLLWRRSESGLSWKNWIRPFVLSGIALVFAASLGGPLQDLALRASGIKTAKVDHAATYQAQRVQLKFPKTNLFQIVVGPESYRRLSYVYQADVFTGLRTLKTAGMKARADFYYAFILSPDVLMMHWLALYLGLPVGFFLLREKRCQAGQVLWCFGLISFLVPGLVDFGPVHEREYFRWEFGAGFGFAGALASYLGLLWARPKRWLKAVVFVLALLVCLGGERKLNRTMIEIEKMPPAQRKRALNVSYPSAHEWILGTEELRMNEDLVLAALELSKRSRASDRMLTDLDTRSHVDIYQESTVAALAGLRSVGHVSPPPWMPDGIAPFYRTGSWNAFWQTGDVRLLPFLNSRWLFCHDPEKAKLLEGQEGLKRVAEFGEVTLWRYEGELGAYSRAPKETAKVVKIERPTSRELRGEVALPMSLTLQDAPEEPFDLGVQWVPLDGTDVGGVIEAVRVRVQPGQDVYPHYLVAPLVEGRYRLQFTINGHTIDRVGHDAVLEFDWTAEAEQARAEWLGDDRIAFVPVSENLAPPLRIGLRLYRLDEKRYSKPFGFEAMGVWTGEDEVVLEKVDQSLTFPLPPGVRGDLYLLDRSGREVALRATREGPVESIPSAK